MNKMINRRAFIGSTAALAAFPGWADEKPLFKMGFMTDTHVGMTKKSCERVKGAFKVFKDQGCCAVVNCGDLADWHYEAGYKFYLEELEDAFPPEMKDRPQFLYVLANHDALDPKRKDPKLRASRMMDLDVAFKDMCARLKIDHWYFEQREICGYPVLVFPQTIAKIGGYGELEKKIAKACADYPGKPVFVCTHMAAKDTCYNSGSWGDAALRKVLNKYPQVVLFSGHTHGSLRNELALWQGEFTAVDVCCLQEWHGISVGTPLAGKQAYGVVVTEVYPSRLVVRRFDVRDGSEIFPDRRWIVPLPFDPKSAPLRVEERLRTAHPGVFAADAKVTCTPDATPFTKVKVAFPAVQNEEDVGLYRIEIARKAKDGGWEKFAICEIFSEFYQRPQDRKGVLEREISCGFFDAGETEYRFSVAPIGFYGTVGQEIATVYRVPAKRPPKVLWRCDNPMDELDFRCGWAKNEEEMRKAKLVPKKDGWYVVDTLSWLSLKPGLWDLPKGTKLRLVAEMSLDQPPIVEGWNFYLKVNDRTERGLRGGWTSTPSGKTEIFRYVVETELTVPGLDYQITFGRGNGGRVRFSSVRLEEMN